MLAGVGLQLGAIDGEGAELHEASALAEVDGLDEETAKRFEMTPAKLADAREVEEGRDHVAAGHP